MLKYVLVAGLLMTQASFVERAEAAMSAGEMQKKVLELAKAGKEKFCRKGNFWSGTISIRSFEGNLCNHPGVAALAMKMCKGIDGFDDSGCAKNAKRVLAGQNPETVIEQQKKADPAIAKVAESVGE